MGILYYYPVNTKCSFNPGCFSAWLNAPIFTLFTHKGHSWTVITNYLCKAVCPILIKNWTTDYSSYVLPEMQKAVLVHISGQWVCSVTVGSEMCCVILYLPCLLFYSVLWGSSWSAVVRPLRCFTIYFNQKMWLGSNVLVWTNAWMHTQTQNSH